MKTRISVIEDSFSIATSGTKTIDYVGQDVISQLIIVPKITNPNAYVPQGHPDECFTKIELIDGSDIIFSGNAMTAKVVDYYSRKRVPPSSMNYMALQWCFSPIIISFGRYLWDQTYALDPKRFTNLQLKITHDLDAAMTTTATGEFTVFAKVFEERPPGLSGFFMTKEHYSITLADSGVTYVDLPEDYPIRLLMPRCFSDTQAPEYNMDELKLTEGHDKRILWDGKTEELVQLISMEYPMWVESVSGAVLTTDRNFWITPSWETRIIPVDFSEANSVVTAESTGGQKKIISGEAACNFESLVQGWCPHGTVCFDFRGMDEPGDYWDVKAGGGGRLKVTCPSSGTDTSADWDLVIQQLRR